MDYLLGVDVGSSNCKVVLVDRNGLLVASHEAGYPTHYPRPGWAEQNPDDWYRVACDSIRQTLTASGVEPRRIGALSVDGPAHNVALMDERGDLIYPCIHWSDLRSVPQSERLNADCGDRIFDLTFTTVNPSWTLAQLMWLRENEPDVWLRLRRVLVTKDYVRYRLTGVYQTDVYDAIGTQLYDVNAGHWSDELCALLGYDPAWLPPVTAATALAGSVTAQAAADTGLPRGLPVAVGSGDSVVEAFGIGAIRPGQCLVKLGTAANVNLVTERAYPSRKSLTYRHMVDGRWFTITATNSGASTMRWFRENFCQPEVEQARARGAGVHGVIDELASWVGPGADGLVFHPYLMGERTPYWDPHLRGDFVGINARHTRHHFARAILEGVAFSLRDCLDVVESLGPPVNELYVIGGGAKSAIWRQILCDVLGRELRKPAVEDAAFGAALVAGLAVGVFPDSESAIAACVRVEAVLRPDEATHSLYDDYFEVYRGVARDLAIHSHRLSALSQRAVPERSSHER